MSLFKSVYTKIIQEARFSTIPSAAKDQSSYKRSKIEDEKAVKEALKKLNLEEFKKLKKDPDNIKLATDVFNTIRGLDTESLNKTNQTKNELLGILLNVTKTPYHDFSNMSKKGKGVNISGFKAIAIGYIRNMNISTDDQLKLVSQVPEWHNLYKNILQEMEGKDTEKFTEYTKRDVSEKETTEDEGPERLRKIEKAEVYYFNRDPSDPDAKPFRTTIIIPPNDYKTQEEKEKNVPIKKAFWSDKRINKSYGQRLPNPWPFVETARPKQLRGKTIEQIRNIVNSSDAELAHKALYPPNKYPQMYTMK